MSKDITEGITNAYEACRSDPYSLENYDRLLGLLQLEKLPLKALEVRYSKHLYFALSQQDIMGFDADIQSIDDLEARAEQRRLFEETLVKEWPSAANWSRYLESLIDSGVNIFESGQYLSALQALEHDWADAGAVWNAIMGAAGNALLDPETLFSLHLRRLACPHSDLDRALSAASSYVSAHFDDYDARMRRASAAHAKALRRARYYEQHELALKKEPSSELWTHYLGEIFAYSARADPHDRYLQIRAVFLRAIATNTDPDSGGIGAPPIWLKFLYCLYVMGEPAREWAHHWAEQFVRSHPFASASHAELVRTLPRADLAQLKKAQKLHHQLCPTPTGPESYDQWKVFAMALIWYEVDAMQNGSDVEAVDLFFQDCRQLVLTALDQNDPFHSVEKLAVEAYVQVGVPDEALAVLRAMTTKFAGQVDVWILRLHQCRRLAGTVDEPNAADSSDAILDQFSEVAPSVDWPLKFILEWLVLQQRPEDIARVDALVRGLVGEKLAQLDESDEEMADGSPGRKRRLSDGPTEVKRARTGQEQVAPQTDAPKRSRELFSVKFSALPPNATEQTVRALVTDCDADGGARDIVLFTEDSGPAAVVELSSDREVLAVLTKNNKTVDGILVKVDRFAGATVWATNYPPSMSPDDVRGEFAAVGPVVSIRFPTQRTKRDRRFCYVEYSDPQYARAAKSSLDGRALVDAVSHKNYTLRVEVSNPAKKPPRPDLEIYVQNLNFKQVSESVLRTTFKRFGDIVLVRVPLSAENAAKNYINNGYAFITFNSEVAAQNALQLDQTELLNRKIKVVPSKANARANPNDFSHLAICLLNIDDTLTKQQVQKFVSDLVGPVKKIEIFPEKFEALVEFENNVDAAKAPLLLSGKKLLEKIIEVRDHTKQQKPQKLMVPPLLRKRR